VAFGSRIRAIVIGTPRGSERGEETARPVSSAWFLDGSRGETSPANIGNPRKGLWLLFQPPMEEAAMHSIIYLVGLVVVVLAVISLLA
jgi:hypothetical protein